MKYVKTFENFEYLLETEQVPADKEGVVSPEETQEIIDDIKAAAKAEMSVKSDFSQEVAKALAQAQSVPEKPKTESFIFESAEGGEILSKDTMQKYADSLVKRLPILKAGDKEVRYRTQKTAIPAGAEYEAYKCHVYGGNFGGGLSVRYKDRTGQYPEVNFEYNTTKEEVAHISKIYSDFGKKLAKRQKWSKFFKNAAIVAIPLGVVAAIGGMFFQGSHHGSGSEEFRAIADLTIAGGAAIAGGFGAAGAMAALDKKIDVAEEAIGMFTALIKAFCDSLNLDMMKLKTIGDIANLFTMEKKEVEVENTTTTSKVESVGNRLKGFKRF